MAGFVHLHVHSHYSLRDSIIQIPALVSRVKELGMPAVALTDHGVMFGAVEFYLEAKKAGIKPIVGMEAYMAPGSLRDRSEGGIGEAARHLTILALDNEGHKNLMQLATIANVEGFYYRPRIDKDVLAEYSAGLAVLSGCLSGEVAKLVLSGQSEKAREALGFMKDVFGPERFYVELMRTEAERQEEVNRALLGLAGELGLEVVATNDVHFLNREDVSVHDLFLAIGSQATIDDENRRRMTSEHYYLKSGEDMAEVFKDVPQALANTLRIAEMADVEIQTGVYHYPKFRQEGVKEGEHETFLRNLTYKGAAGRYGEPLPPEVDARIKTELADIGDMDLTDYMLIVWDVVHFARGAGISVGPGRGSAAGSIVCYCLGITEVDPMKYELLFERFINKGRNEMPDIDIDFHPDRRHEIVEYLEKKYGEDCVKPIVAFSTLGPKAAIRDVVRALGLPSGRADEVCRHIPNLVSLPDALENIPELSDLHAKDEELRHIIDLALRLEGTVRQCTVHAAGIVVADRPLVNYCPLYRNASTDTVTTQYEMGVIDKVGLLKIDLLGLANLAIIDRAVELVREREKDFDPDKIPLDDEKTYKTFSGGRTRGVFQFESAGMRRLIQQAEPSNIEDLIALNALFRPGPLQNGYTDLWVNRKHGREKAQTLHPIMDEVLKPTYGVIVYQEQVMRLSSEMGGFTLSEADRLRKAMGKKDADVMAAYRETFIRGGKERSIEESVTSRIYDSMARFAEYGFNKSHSAAYALLAYKTAYLKTNYPAEYMAALMSFEKDSAKVVEYIDDAREMGLEVLPPDINKSGVDFAVAGGRILFGLSAIKGLGEKAAQAIIEERGRGGPFEDFFDFIERVDTRLVNRQVLQVLVKAGAFDAFGHRRSALYMILEDALNSAQRMQDAKRRGQHSLFGGGGPADQDSLKPTLPDVPEWSGEEKLEGEKEVLGFWVSDHPMSRYQHEVERYITHSLNQTDGILDGEEVVVAGMIVKKEVRRSKRNGQLWARAYVNDGTRQVQAIVFPRVYEEARDLLEVTDEPLVFKGRMEKQEEEAVLKVEQIYSLRDAPGVFSRRIILGLGDAVDERRMRLVRETIERHPGEVDLSFELAVDGRRVSVRAGDDFKVDPGNGFVEEAEELLGADNVHIVTPYRRREAAVIYDGAEEELPED